MFISSKRDCLSKAKLSLGLHIAGPLALIIEARGDKNFCTSSIFITHQFTIRSLKVSDLSNLS